MKEIMLPKAYIRKIKKVKNSKKESKSLQKLANHLANKYFNLNHICPVVWNSNLKTSGGYFTPLGGKIYSIKGAKKLKNYPFITINPQILLRNNYQLLANVVKHELIHYYLWLKHKPWGHNQEFHRIMHKIGANRHVPVPEEYIKPFHRFKYDYECPRCHQGYYTNEYLPPSIRRCAKDNTPLKLTYIKDKSDFMKEKYLWQKHGYKTD